MLSIIIQIKQKKLKGNNLTKIHDWNKNDNKLTKLENGYLKIKNSEINKNMQEMNSRMNNCIDNYKYVKKYEFVIKTFFNHYFILVFLIKLINILYK